MRRSIVAAGLAIAILSGWAWSQTLSNPRVEEAVQKGIKYFWDTQKPDGSWGAFGAKPGSPPPGYQLTGPTALAVLALLEAGVSPQEAKMQKALAWLADQKETETYSLGIRANVWTAANRTTDGKFAKLLDRDVAQLIKSSPTGAISYTASGKAQAGGWDNSNSQYLLLGVWAGIMGDSEEVNAAYIKKVMGHWMGCQQRDGGWTYHDNGPSTHTMTVAGLASMFVCFDYISTISTAFQQCNRGTGQPKAIAKGMEWLEAKFQANAEPYYMYGVERVALASGYKYFGKHDWYKLGSAALVAAQQDDGGWGGCHGNRTAGSALTMLFLIRGKNPVLFNKLEYQGDWSNRPRDLANLTRWMTTKIFDNITVNWQIINLNTPVAEWHDAPILYIGGSIAPEIKPEQLAKIREFVNQGGTVFSCTECGGQGFSKAISTITQQLFPAYKLEPIPAGHPLNTKATHFDIEGQRSRLQVMTNGSRPLWIHSDVDLPLQWQGNKIASQRWAFETMINVTRYVASSPKLLRSRGTTHWPAAATAADKTVKVARLQYNGNFDPEPLALERLSLICAQEDKTRLDIAVMPIAKLPDAGVKVAFLTGTKSWKPDEQEAAALKAFTEKGGTLVIDACGGSRDFDQSAQTWLEDIYGSRTLRPLAQTSPVYANIQQAKYRDRTKAKLGNLKTCNLKAVLVNNRTAVLYSAEDITTALLGTHSFVVDGYLGETAVHMARNIIAEANK